jgi:hypothetical protein
MNFELSDDQLLLGDSVERMSTEHYSFASRNAYLASDAGWSREEWRRYARMGLLAFQFARVRAVSPAIGRDVDRHGSLRPGLGA